MKRQYILYTCSCGVHFSKRSDYTYNITNCTQCQRKIKNKKLIKHGHCQRKGNRSKKSITYITWDAMKQRCLNHNHKHYINYGERGVEVCERWLSSFENFLEDMGEKPQGSTIERIDNEMGYFKENCKWADRKTQQNNRRKNIVFEFNNETKTAQQWCDNFDISWNTVKGRIKRGMDPYVAFTKPINRRIWENREIRPDIEKIYGKQNQMDMFNYYE